MNKLEALLAKIQNSKQKAVKSNDQELHNAEFQDCSQSVPREMNTAPVKQSEFEMEYIVDVEKAQNIIAGDLNTDDFIGFDIETMKLPRFKDHPQAGLSPHLSDIRLAQLCAGKNKVFVFDVPRVGLDILRPVFDRRLVAHNAVFEMSHLYHAGIDLPFIDCTRLMDNALNNGVISLKEMAKKILKIDISKDEQTSDWGAPELSPDQLYYAAMDAWLVKALHPILQGQIVRKKRQALYELLRNAQRPIMKMTYTGLNFDIMSHQKLMENLNNNFRSAENKLRQVVGEKINFASNKQLSNFYKEQLPSKTLKKWNYTKKGDLCLDKNTVKNFANIPIVEPLAEYKRLKKLLDSFGNSMLKHINPATGRVHPNYIIAGARGGRFTCSKPNLQQIPRDKEYRCLFNVPAGRKMIVADYSQVELRVLAMIAKEPAMLEAYKKRQDLHRLTASVISKVPFEEVTKEQRSAAKAVNFGLVFGMGAQSLADYARNNYGVEMTLQQAKVAKEAYFTKYPGIKAWHHKTNRAGKQYGLAKTRTGRVERLIPEKAYTQSKNIPVQGSASEILLATLAELDQKTAETGLDIRIVHIVHDEIVLETAEELAGQAKDILMDAMTAGMLKVFPEAFTKGLVEANIGDSWGGAK